MLDHHRQRIEQCQIIKQLRRIRICAGREHAGQIADSMIEVWQLEEYPEHGDTNKNKSHPRRPKCSRIDQRQARQKWTLDDQQCAVQQSPQQKAEASAMPKTAK